MMKYRLSLLAGLVAFCSAGLAQSESFSSLEERMTGREWQETGLYKLSPEELAALNRWIRQRSLAEHELAAAEEAARPSPEPGTAEAPADTRGLPAPTTPRDPIRTTIVGTFDGWRGGEEFELANGMVWRQTGEDTFFIPPVENPEVTIRPALFGGWQLQVEGYNQRTRVERVR